MLPTTKYEASQTMKMLPEGFEPSDNDVTFGRGRSTFLHAGNIKFRRLVADSLREYSESTTKLEKSYILRKIVTQVRLSSPNGGFVKRDTRSGRWYEVGDFLAREKTSQAFRDALFENYKSSNTAKKLRRIHQETHLPHHRSSVISLEELTYNVSNESCAPQRSGISWPSRDRTPNQLVSSCPSLGQSINMSMSNLEWYSSSKHVSIRALAATNSSESHPAFLFDFACVGVEYPSLDLDSESLSHEDASPTSQAQMSMSPSQPQIDFQFASSFSDPSSRDYSWASSTVGVDQVPVHDIFDRLVNLIDLHDPNDPFEPHPVQQSSLD